VSSVKLGRRTTGRKACSGTVSVIDTATNTVVATVAPVGPFNFFGVGVRVGGVAVTPDGKHVYIVNNGSTTVSVIDTVTNTVEAATLTVGNGPIGVGIIPDVPFLAFSAALEIHFGSKPNTDAFALESSFTLSSTAPAINPVTQAVTLQAGTFAATLPPGSFKKFGGWFTFAGVINGVNLQAVIFPTGTLRYAFLAAAERASLTGTANQVTARVSIGAGSSTTSVAALIFH
jgi:YVTN family beta-propeller protein